MARFATVGVDPRDVHEDAAREPADKRYRLLIL
jgi:hypothetical protein